MNQSQAIRWRQFGNAAEFEQAACDFVVTAAQEAITKHGVFRIVLAGGNTPRNIYRRLCDIATDWSAWHVYFGDERCLPVADSERNSRMAHIVWLDHVAIPTAQIHPIPAEQGPEAAAASYADNVVSVGEFDLVLLGLGEDGHTASLFPGSAWERAETLPAAIPVFDAPKPPPQRVSLSPDRLSRTRHVLYLACGEAKRQTIESWRAGATFPAGRISSASGVDVFYV